MVVKGDSGIGGDWVLSTKDTKGREGGAQGYFCLNCDFCDYGMDRIVGRIHYGARRRIGVRAEVTGEHAAQGSHRDCPYGCG